MIEEWHYWKPPQKLEPGYGVDIISCEEDNFSIELYATGPKDSYIKLDFQGNAQAYRYTNESFALQTLCNILNKYGPDFYPQWSFFTVTKSTYLSAYEHDTNTTVSSLIHFAIIGEDEIVDVITTKAPIVTFIDIEPLTHSESNVNSIES